MKVTVALPTPSDTRMLLLYLFLALRLVVCSAGDGATGGVPEAGLRHPGGRGAAAGAAREPAGRAQRAHAVQGTRDSHVSKNNNTIWKITVTLLY